MIITSPWQQCQGKRHALLMQLTRSAPQKAASSLGKIEHAAGFVYQPKADGDQRIQGAGEQAAEQGFKEELSSVHRSR